MSEQPSSPPQTQARILIVDDHPGMANMLGRTISQLGPGIEVIAATGGKEALSQVQDLGVDLLITDMMMPDMNGMELIEKLRAHPAGKPAFNILMTAYDVPGLKESARRLKVNETIIKPFPPERLRSIVQKALEGIAQARPSAVAAESSQKFKILIADDINDNVVLLSRYLQSEGFTFLTAGSGTETLALTRAEMPDLILLDVNMPGKDGFEVLKELRADPAIEHIPVIILTAARLESMDVQTGLNLGADDYMTKPFDRRELLARIRTKLRAKESEDNIRRRTREFGVLPEIGREFCGRRDLKELSDIILRRTVETLGAGVGHIFLIHPSGSLHREYRLGEASPSIPVDLLPPLAALQDQIRDLPQGLIVSEARADPLWHSMTDNSLTRSVLVVPLFGRFELIGLIVLGHEKSGYFNADHQLLLRAIASQAAIAAECALMLTHPYRANSF